MSSLKLIESTYELEEQTWMEDLLVLHKRGNFYLTNLGLPFYWEWFILEDNLEDWGISIVPLSPCCREPFKVDVLKVAPEEVLFAHSCEKCGSRLTRERVYRDSQFGDGFTEPLGRASRKYMEKIIFKATATKYFPGVVDLEQEECHPIPDFGRRAASFLESFASGFVENGEAELELSLFASVLARDAQRVCERELKEVTDLMEVNSDPQVWTEPLRRGAKAK